MDDARCVTPGLGENPYLIASHGGAVLGDPYHTAWHLLAVAEANKWRLRYVLETHVHNDSLSGALEVRRATGTAIGAAAKGGYAFPDVKWAEDDAIQAGALQCIALETPGHTREPTSSVVHEDTAPDPAVVRTGGSLSIRSAGRTALGGRPIRPPSPGRPLTLSSDSRPSWRRPACSPPTGRAAAALRRRRSWTGPPPWPGTPTPPALAASDEDALICERLPGCLPLRPTISIRHHSIGRGQASWHGSRGSWP
jgi:hypothetical protein